MAQLGLFDDETQPQFAAEHRLASALPQGVHFGTSSWTFTGWSGVLYPPGTTESELLRRGLALYCKNPLLTTVGIDSSFYRPLSRSTLANYARQLPGGFRCVSKVSRELTTPCGPDGRSANPRFLDARFFEQMVLEPIVEAFQHHQGPLILQFGREVTRQFGSPTHFALSLRRFFTAASKQFEYAVELRDPALLTPTYVEVLERFGVVHVCNYWEAMPSLAWQFERVHPTLRHFCVIRLLIPPGRRYQDRKSELEPFDRLVDEQPSMRRDVVSIARQLHERGSRLYVLVNNKVEGCSPLTIRALVELLIGQPWVGSKNATP